MLKLPEAREGRDTKENLKEELCDLIFTALFLADLKCIKPGGILKKVNNKMIFRHPHVFKDPKDISIEQADIIWKEQKRKEKELNIIH